MRGAAAVGLQNEMFSLPPCSHHALRAAVRSPMSSLVTEYSIGTSATKVKAVARQVASELELPRVRLRPRHAVLGGAVARALAVAAEPQRRAPRRAVHPHHVGDDRDVAAAARVRVLLERPHALDELGDVFLRHRRGALTLARLAQTSGPSPSFTPATALPL